MNYLEEKLTYTSDGKLLDSQGRAVMMDWERDIMKESAKVVCENGGRVLNIGFGLGLIDSFIQTYPIDEHWIIEAHTDVISKMKSDGWFDKDNVTVISSKWQDALGSLPKFDGIYFDTWNDFGMKEKLVPCLPKLLNLGGVFSYWGHHPNIEKENKLFNRFGMEVTSTSLQLDNIPPVSEQGDLYWNRTWTNYSILKIRKVKEVVYNKHLI